MTSPAIRAVLAGVAAAAVAGPVAVVLYPPALPTRARVAAKVPPRRVVPPTALPSVEPVRLVDLSLDEARVYNAGIPFVTGPKPVARPFRFAGGSEDLARARDCLAAALIYEAGDDATGERAVAQVVLNRLRHPAFPKSVCGVVFEGQDRTTGCQFTFTCDGALTRWQPSPAAWTRARNLAGRALAGAVDRPVGYATHYHTDWVVPYWQSSLDKIARVGTHLFFRWTGWWGTPPAFDRRTSGAEPAIAKLAALSDAHKTAAALAEADAALAEGAAVTGEGAVPMEDNWFVVTLPPAPLPVDWPAVAKQACGDRPKCTYTGWRDSKQTPTALPLAPEQIAAMSFSYRRNRAEGVERSLWNCQQIPRAVRSECMKTQVLLTAPVPAASPATAPTPARGPAVLGGVRRAAPIGVPHPASPVPTAD